MELCMHFSTDRKKSYIVEQLFMTPVYQWVN